MAVDLMSSLFKYLGQTARVKNQSGQRADQTLQSKKTHYLLSPLSSPLFPLVSSLSSLSMAKNKCGERASERENCSRDENYFRHERGRRERKR